MSHFIIKKLKKCYEVEHVLTWVKEYSEEGILLFSFHLLHFVLKSFLCVAILIAAHIQAPNFVLKRIC